MPTKPLDRLLFAQGGLCFFCKHPLSAADASVEHLVASAHGGSNRDDNCVACCKSLNALLGCMSLKEKVQVILNQKGQFRCPNGAGQKAVPRISGQTVKPAVDRYAQVLANLQQRGNSKPQTVTKLKSTIGALFKKTLTAEEIESLVQRLQTGGVVTIAGTKVTYA